MLGKENGRWAQVLPDGEERQLEGNCGRQAIDGTFAISDAMRSLARAKGGNDETVDFKRRIDTVVGMWEAIPEGSAIEPPRHVTVQGYRDLLERLVAPGPKVPWTDGDWDEFALHHGLYQPEDDSPAERRRRNSLQIVSGYRLRARDSLAEGLKPPVDLGATGRDGTRASAQDIDRMVADGRTVAIAGPSGSGKSFLARHLAVRHCDAGRLVVWVRAADYEGRFSDLLSLATAPYSPERRGDLTRAAEAAGTAIMVVLDGLNECPEHERGEMLKQLKAFLLRHPAGVLVTTTTQDGLAGTLGAAILHAGEPDEEAREAILASYGARRPERISEQLRTPHELSIAAECECELAANASAADMHDAFIRRHAPAERVRAGLRALAGRLHAKLGTSIPLIEAAAALNAETPGLGAGVVDDVLANPLIEVDRHRVRFRHELFGQFLAAGQLVLSADSASHLADLLGSPANNPLAETALHIERDGRRTWGAMKALRDAGLMLSAVVGGYGPETAAPAAADIRDVLHAGIAAADPKRASFEATESEHRQGWALGGCWATPRRWSDTELALLAVAGMSLHRGLFVDEACELIDRTDELCQTRARLLQADGTTNPISTVVEATLSQMAHQEDRENCGLAVPYVVAAFGRAKMLARFGANGKSRGLALRLADGAGGYSWGRFYFALLAADPADPADRAVFLSLLRRVWDAGGYHLQLEALETAKTFGMHGGTEDPHRTEIIEVLHSIETGDLFLSTSLVEALAQFGEIETETTVEELQERIREIMSGPDDMESCQAARGIVSMQYETQEIVGPCFEAIEELTVPEKVRLFTMAARGSEPGAFLLYSTLGQLADLVPTANADLDKAAKDAFESFLDGPPEDVVMPQEAASACRAAICGWARFDRSIPPGPGEATAAQRSWRLAAGLLLAHERDDAEVDVEDTWRTLLADPGQTVATLA